MACQISAMARRHTWQNGTRHRLADRWVNAGIPVQAVNSSLCSTPWSAKLLMVSAVFLSPQSCHRNSVHHAIKTHQAHLDRGGLAQAGLCSRCKLLPPPPKKKMHTRHTSAKLHTGKAASATYLAYDNWEQFSRRPRLNQLRQRTAAMIPEGIFV